MRRELRDKWGIAALLKNLGNVACDQGDYASARSLLAESLVLRREVGDKRGIAESLEASAVLRVAEGPEQAVQLWGAAEALRDVIGAPLPPNEHSRYECGIEAVRAQFDEAGYASAWAEGQTMSLDEAIAYALSSAVKP
jgi:hypothetical protein